MKKVLQELFWVHFFGHPYRSNGTKIHLDAALHEDLVYLQIIYHYAYYLAFLATEFGCPNQYTSF